MNKNELNNLSKEILDAAIVVHMEMGHWLLESVYEACLIEELGSRNINASRQIELPLIYKGKKFNK